MANISEELSNIKTAIYGKDVRESIYNGIDVINKESANTLIKQIYLESTFNQLIINSGNSNAEIVDARVKENGTSYTKLGDRLDAVDSQLDHIENFSVHVDRFKTNLNTDDEAIDEALKCVGSIGTLEFSNRTYNITKPIIIEGKQISLIGKFGNSTEIKAISNMESMVITSSPEGFHGHKTIRGIVFNTNNLAKSCIDASDSRYTTIQDNNFLCEHANYILKIGSWVNRIVNNKFTSNQEAYGLVLVSDTNNNTVIKDNSFTSCKIGIKSEGAGNSVIIQSNTFDMCKDTGILLQLGTRHMVIKDNYFEGCGLNSSTTVQTGASSFENWHGAIICHTVYNVLTVTHNNLTIENNMFANCNADSIMTLSNITNANISKNSVYELYKYNNFIKLKGSALPSNENSRFFYSHSNVNSVISRILKLDTIRNREYTNNISTDNDIIKLDSNIENYTQLTPDTPLTIEKKTDFGTYYDISSSSSSRVIEKEFNINGNIKGKNIQLEYETRGKFDNSALWITLYVNSVEVESIQKGGSEWYKVSSMYELPDGTVSIKIRIRPIVGDKNILLRNLNINIF